MIQTFRRHKMFGAFKPMAFKQEAALLSEGENMFAFQYCKIPDSDSTIIHMEFLGVISEAEEDDDDSEMKGENTVPDVASDTVMKTVERVEASVPKRPRRQ